MPCNKSETFPQCSLYRSVENRRQVIFAISGKFLTIGIIRKLLMSRIGIHKRLNLKGQFLYSLAHSKLVPWAGKKLIFTSFLYLLFHSSHLFWRWVAHFLIICRVKVKDHQGSSKIKSKSQEGCFSLSYFLFLLLSFFVCSPCATNGFKINYLDISFGRKIAQEQHRIIKKRRTAATVEFNITVASILSFLIILIFFQRKLSSKITCRLFSTLGRSTMGGMKIPIIIHNKIWYINNNNQNSKLYSCIHILRILYYNTLTQQLIHYHHHN